MIHKPHMYIYNYIYIHMYHSHSSFLVPNDLRGQCFFFPLEKPTS
jgi:hypothetical protein